MRYRLRGISLYNSLHAANHSASHISKMELSGAQLGPLASPIDYSEVQSTSARSIEWEIRTIRDPLNFQPLH